MGLAAGGGAVTRKPAPALAGARKAPATRVKAPPGLAAARKAPILTEARFQSQVVTLARLLGWVAWHCVMPKRSAAGLPDLLLLRDRALWFELKSERGRLRPEQVAFIARLRDAGQAVYVLKPSDWPTIERLLT